MPAALGFLGCCRYFVRMTVADSLQAFLVRSGIGGYSPQSSTRIASALPATQIGFVGPILSGQPALARSSAWTRSSQALRLTLTRLTRIQKRPSGEVAGQQSAYRRDLNLAYRPK